MICIKDDVNALSKKNEVAIEKLEDEVNGINGEFSIFIPKYVKIILEQNYERVLSLVF